MKETGSGQDTRQRTRVVGAEPLVDVQHVAEMLGVRAAWVYERVAAGQLPHYKVGRYIRFKVSELEGFLQSCRRGRRSEGS